MNELYLQRMVIDDAPKEDYLNHLAAIASVQRQGGLDLSNPVTFFVGENGTGKSTLLEAVAVASGLNAEGGSRNFTFSTQKTHSDLSRSMKLVRGYRRPKDSFFLRAESFYNVATNIDELDGAGGLGNNLIDSYGGKSLHQQSHGESFLSLLLHRFGGNGLYLLDEPEAALSVTRQMAFLTRMHELIKAGSQFIIATHSPILLAYPDAVIYQFTASGVEKIPYEQTEPFLVTRQFLNQPQRMLSILLEE